MTIGPSLPSRVTFTSTSAPSATIRLDAGPMVATALGSGRASSNLRACSAMASPLPATMSQYPAKSGSGGGATRFAFLAMLAATLLAMTPGLNQTLSSFAATSSPPETMAKGPPSEAGERSPWLGLALAFTKKA